MRKISFGNYIVLSGFLAIFCEVLLVVGWTLNIERNSLLGSILTLFGYVLTVFATIGICALHFTIFDFRGKLGAALTIFASTLFTSWLFLDVARISEVVPFFDWAEVQSNGPTHKIGVVGGVSFVLGFFLIGFDAIRSGLLPKWPAYVMILASLMPLVYSLVPIGKLLPRIGGLAFIGYGIEMLLFMRRDGKIKTLK